MTDIVIIGAGPAGLTAAIYARRAGKSVTLLESLIYGGQIVNTPDIENYPGLAHVSGFDFASTLYEQATGFGAVMEMEKATGIVSTPEGKIVKTESGKEFPCKAVIIATGAKNRKLGLPKEEKLVGHGVSYCATCDGLFFKGKDVAVNGGGNTAIGDALYLSGICKTVYLIHRRDQFRGAERDVEKLKQKDNIVFVLNSTVTDLVGDKKLEGVVVTDKTTGESKTLSVSALFVAIGQSPDNKDFDGVVDLDAKGYVAAGEDCLTKTGGVFVAGDCRGKALKQLTTAVSDGAMAATQACAYIG